MTTKTKDLRQECRDYMDQQINHIKQEIDKKLQVRNLDSSVNGDGPVSNNTMKLAQLYQKKPEPSEQMAMPRVLMVEDSREPEASRKSVVSWSVPESGGKTPKLKTYGSQLVQVPEELQHLDWSQARMAGNWKPVSNAQGVVLLDEVYPPNLLGEGEEVTDEAIICQSGLGADNEGAPPVTDGKVPNMERISIVQTDKKIAHPKGNGSINSSNQEKTTKLSTSNSEPRLSNLMDDETRLLESTRQMEETRPMEAVRQLNFPIRKEMSTAETHQKVLDVHEVHSKTLTLDSKKNWRNEAPSQVAGNNYYY